MSAYVNATDKGSSGADAHAVPAVPAISTVSAVPAVGPAVGPANSNDPLVTHMKDNIYFWSTV